MRAPLDLGMSFAVERLANDRVYVHPRGVPDQGVETFDVWNSVFDVGSTRERVGIGLVSDFRERVRFLDDHLRKLVDRRLVGVANIDGTARKFPGFGLIDQGQKGFAKVSDIAEAASLLSSIVNDQGIAGKSSSNEGR